MIDNKENLTTEEFENVTKDTGVNNISASETACSPNQYNFGKEYAMRMAIDLHKGLTNEDSIIEKTAEMIYNFINKKD